MKEIELRSFPGIPLLLLYLAVFVGCIWLFIAGIRAANGWMVGGALLVALTDLLLMIGFYMVEPNQAAVVSLFGKYVGTVKTDGLRWNNPFFGKRKVSLRVRNFESGRLKVNEL